MKHIKQFGAPRTTARQKPQTAELAPTGGVTSADLAGKLFAVEDQRGAEILPVLMRIGGDSETYLPLFDTEGALRAQMRELGVTSFRIKQVTEEGAFLESVPAHVKVIYGLVKVEKGRMRWHEVQRVTH